MGGRDRSTVLCVGSFGDPSTPPGRVVEQVTDLTVRSVPDAATLRETLSAGTDRAAEEIGAVVLAEAPTEELLAALRERAPALALVLVGARASMPAAALEDQLVRAVRDDGTDRTARVVAAQLDDCCGRDREPTIALSNLPLPAFTYDGEFREATERLLACVDRTAEELRGASLSAIFDCDEAALASAASDGRPLTVSIPSTGAPRTRPLWVGRDAGAFVGILGEMGEADGLAASMLDSLFDAVPLSMYVKDRRGRHVAVSDHLVGGMAADRSTIDAPDGTIHHVPADVIGKTDFDLYPAANAEQFRETDERVIEDGEVVIERENVRLTGDEQRFAVTDIKLPWYRDGEIAGVIGLAIDDTDCWRAKRRAAIQADVLETVETVLRTALGPRLDDGDTDPAIEAAVGDLQTLVAIRQLPHAAEATDLGDRARSVWPEGAGTLRIEDSAVIDAHPSLLETLLAELFENARAFAGPDPTVRIGTLDDGFFLEDDGPGIPPARRSKVCRYGTTERDDRLGSGLAIVEAIARAHGWTVTITDGSTGGARLAVTDVRIY